MQYEMVIFSLSIYLYWDMDFCLAVLVCEPLGRRFITIHWDDKQFLFSSHVINFYSIFCQLFSYSLIISFVKTILHNLHHKMRYPTEKILQEMSVSCPLMNFLPISRKHFETKSFMLAAHQLDTDAAIYLFLWLVS